MNPSQQVIRPQAKFYIQTVIINAVLMSLASGYSMVYFNAIPFDDLYTIFQLDIYKPLAQGLLTGCIPASACIGAFLTKVLLNLLSRKSCFYFLDIMLIIGVGCIQTKFIILIFTGRILQGIYVGAASAIVSLYVKQFIPQMNGKYGLYNQFSFTIGVVLAFGISLIFHSTLQNSDQYWRYHFVFPVIIVILQILLTFFKFNNQTPRYLITQGLYDEAKQLLNKIYIQKHAQQQFRILFEAVKSKSQLQKFEENNIKSIQNYQETQSRQVQSNQSSERSIQKKQNKFVIVEQNIESNQKLTQNLLAKPKESKSLNNKLAIFCAIHLSFEQQIIGIGAVIVYSSDIINEVVPQIYHYYSLIVHSFGLFCVGLGVYLIRKLGRVTMIQGGGVIICVCLLIVGVNFLLEENRIDMLIMVCVILIRGTFSCTLGPIVWLYMAEIIKPNIIPYGTFINWFAATLVMLSYPIIKDYLGNPGGIFIFNAIMCGSSTIINYFTLVQTKDKNELMIRKEYDQKLQKLSFCR